MEKGEIAILTGQFGALVLVILLFSNFVPGGASADALSTPTIGAVYWGPVSAGVQLARGGTTTVTTNATTVTVDYALAFSTTPASVTGTRLCANVSPNDYGQELVYTNFTVDYKTDSFTFVPTSQPLGAQCTYTLQLTDSLQQPTIWEGTVVLKNASAN